MGDTDGLYTFTDELETDVGKPCDFSFKKFTEMKAIDEEDPPRGMRVGGMPHRSYETRKYLSRSIWLNNNKLKNLNGLEDLVNSVLEKPEKLAWLDFSFNEITELDDVLLRYKEITILYLHGNKIETLDTLLRLRRLRNLRNLTLHGNPISDEYNYRNCVIAICPQIVSLDFAPILKSERIRPPPPLILKRVKEYEHPTAPPAKKH